MVISDYISLKGNELWMWIVKVQKYNFWKKSYEVQSVSWCSHASEVSKRCTKIHAPKFLIFSALKFVKNELNRGHTSVHVWLAIYLKLFNWRKALSFQRFSLTKSGFYQIILYPLKLLERIKVFLKGFLQYKLKGIFYFKLLFTA